MRGDWNFLGGRRLTAGILAPLLILLGCTDVPNLPPAPAAPASMPYLVQPGDINPDHIVTPGVYVKRMIHVPNAKKHIEQRTVRKRPAPAGTGEEV